MSQAGLRASTKHPSSSRRPVAFLRIARLDSQKNWIWRAPIGLGDVAHKNFFVAKNADSEFTPRVFELRRRAATSAIEFLSQLT